jgi:hypothetical protein
LGHRILEGLCFRHDFFVQFNVISCFLCSPLLCGWQQQQQQQKAAQQYIPTITREIKLLQELNILSEYANFTISNRFLLPEQARR